MQLLVADMASGSLATLAHDGISTPIDVIKQRMQVGGHDSFIYVMISAARLIHMRDMTHSYA